MGGMDITYGGAFIAGTFSFLSPCVLPLVPPYLYFLGEVTLGQITNEGTIDRAVSRRVFISALAFVLGFSTVFTGLGASASTFGPAIADYVDILSKIAGGMIIILGLHFMSIFRISMLFRDARFHMESKPSGLAGAYVLFMNDILKEEATLNAKSLTTVKMPNRNGFILPAPVRM